MDACSTVFNVVYVPKWQLAGGLLGAVYIFIMILAVPKIGVASAVLAVITGQILTSMVIDHFGWRGIVPLVVDFCDGLFRRFTR